MIIFCEWISVSRKDYTLVAQEFFISCGIFVGGHPQNDAVPRLDVFLQAVEGGSLFDARRAPGRPEIQYDHFPFEIREMRRLTGNFQREVSRRLIPHPGFASPVRAPL